MGDTKIQWHPGFVAAMNLELREYRDSLVFEKEYNLNTKPLEIDFLVQAGNSLLPIEVKAEENVKSKSLRQFITVDNAAYGLHGYRFSMKGFEHQEWMSNIPLFAIKQFITGKADEGKL